LSTEGVYSRDMGRGNSREGGGVRRSTARGATQNGSRPSSGRQRPLPFPRNPWSPLFPLRAPLPCKAARSCVVARACCARRSAPQRAALPALARALVRAGSARGSVATKRQTVIPLLRSRLARSGSGRGVCFRPPSQRLPPPPPVPLPLFPALPLSRVGLNIRGTLDAGRHGAGSIAQQPPHSLAS